ncbi:MAG: hypothetical protein K2R93_10100 [Gemmatimonadaceae bacterium]|nr:hypothetical protein [Gemmatimonadaceae bacterium]
MTLPPLSPRSAPRRISLRRLLVGTIALTLAACKGDAPVPSSATAVTTVTIAAPVASRLSEMNAPVVKIADAKGKPMRNLLVRWKVTSGGGSVINDSSRTDAQGQATSGGWNLGTTAGVQTLTATLDGLPPVTFTANAVPGPISELTPVTTTFTTTVVNQTVVPSPAVLAKDAYGNIVPGGQVVFALAQSQGTLVGETQATNAQGIATLASWQLGTTAGTQSVRATSPTAQAITISVTARPGPVTKLIALTQPDVAGVVSTAVGATPTVRTADAFNNGVPNIPVTWTLGANSGTITTPTAVSDANGVATPGAWVLGTATTQTLTASSSAVPGTTLAFTARPVTTLFDIGLVFVGSGGTEVMRDAFRSAATRWRSVITGDVQTSRLTAPASSCASWQPAVDSTINDVLIWARIGPIDGVNNILARAGPCYINQGTRLTVAGIMEFDEADLPNLINNGGIVDVITHEMGHVLGIGTLWNFGGRSLLVGAGSGDPYFQGAAARAGFTAVNTVLYSGNPVPVENSGGSGTRDSHWRETTFGRELMTGFYNSGALNPLSRITIGSLEDLGYQVNYNASEPYSITALLYTFPFTPSANLIPIIDDVTSIPLYELRNGRGVLIRAAR